MLANQTQRNSQPDSFIILMTILAFQPRCHFYRNRMTLVPLGRANRISHFFAYIFGPKGFCKILVVCSRVTKDLSLLRISSNFSLDRMDFPCKMYRTYARTVLYLYIKNCFSDARLSDWNTSHYQLMRYWSSASAFIVPIACFVFSCPTRITSCFLNCTLQNFSLLLNLA